MDLYYVAPFSTNTLSRGMAVLQSKISPDIAILLLPIMTNTVFGDIIVLLTYARPLFIRLLAVSPSNSYTKFKSKQVLHTSLSIKIFQIYVLITIFLIYVITLFIHRVALARRQQTNLTVIESSCHLLIYLPHTMEASR